MNQELTHAREPVRGIAMGVGLALPVWLFVGLATWWAVLHYSSARHASRLAAAMRLGSTARQWMPARFSGRLGLSA